MKTQYKYFYFELAPKYTYIKRKTHIWYCVGNNSGILGTIKWFGRWRQYCFFPANETIFSAGCINDISDFLKQTNEEHRMKNKINSEMRKKE